MEAGDDDPARRRKTFQTLWENRAVEWEATLQTLSTGFRGFLFALVIGTVIGALVARNRILRAAVGSMITGLQTMPSVAWVPSRSSCSA